MKRLIVLVALLPLLIAAKAADGSCYVSPNPSQFNASLGYASFTINATAPAVQPGDTTLVNVTDPNGIENYWSVENTTGSFALPWQERYAGNGKVTILQRRSHGTKDLASCAFTVLP